MSITEPVLTAAGISNNEIDPARKISTESERLVWSNRVQPSCCTVLGREANLGERERKAVAQLWQSSTAAAVTVEAHPTAVASLGKGKESQVSEVVVSVPTRPYEYMFAVHGHD